MYAQQQLIGTKFTEGIEMTVAELIELLKAQPQENEVSIMDTMKTENSYATIEKIELDRDVVFIIGG